MRTYTAEIDTPDDGTACECSSCDAVLNFRTLVEIDECVLTPGDQSPAGRCPHCEALAYVRTPKTVAADAADRMLAALQSVVAWYHDPHLDDDDFEDVLAGVRAAIAAATNVGKKES